MSIAATNTVAQRFWQKLDLTLHTFVSQVSVRAFYIIINKHSHEMSLQLTQKVAAGTDRKHILSWRNRLNLVPIIEKKKQPKTIST